MWRLLGYAASHAKLPYASMLFGDTPQATLEPRPRGAHARVPGREVRLGRLRHRLRRGRCRPRRRGSRGPGRRRPAARRRRARSGTTTWSVPRSGCRPSWPPRATWLEEPFLPHAFAAHAALARRAGDGRDRRRRGRPHRAHGHEPHRLRRRPLRPDRCGPDRRHRRVEGRGGPCRRARRHLRQPHVHVAPGAVGLAPALRRAGGPPHLRVPGGPQAGRARPVDERTSCPMRTARSAPRTRPGLGIEVDLAGVAPYLRSVEILRRRRDASSAAPTPDRASRRSSVAVGPSTQGPIRGRPSPAPVPGAQPGRRPGRAALTAGYAMRGLQGRVINAVGSQIVGGRFAPGDVLPTEAELTAEHRREPDAGPGGDARARGEGDGGVPAEARHARPAARAVERVRCGHPALAQRAGARRGAADRPGRDAPAAGAGRGPAGRRARHDGRPRPHRAGASPRWPTAIRGPRGVRHRGRRVPPLGLRGVAQPAAAAVRHGGRRPAAPHLQPPAGRGERTIRCWRRTPSATSRSSRRSTAGTARPPPRRC